MNQTTGRLPRISLITPSYQQADYLEECLRSIHDQGYPALEHIVVDGGSTDRSPEIIKAHSHNLKWWCSEKDNGQSDALNKGIGHATGDVFSWLNSDDRLVPGALERIGKAFQDDPDLLIYEGVRCILHPDGSRVPEPQNDITDELALFTRPYVNQQSLYFRMSAIKAVGGVDTALHHVMDLELWWRILFTFGTKQMKVEPVEIADFRMHELSKTGMGYDPFINEQASVLHGACLLNGENELADIIAVGHKLSKGLRPMTPSVGHAELVRKIVLAFLMKWHWRIYREGQFDMMRRLLDRVPRKELQEVAAEEKIVSLEEQLRAKSWLFFRVRRKWKHLLG